MQTIKTYSLFLFCALALTGCREPQRPTSTSFLIGTKTATLRIAPKDAKKLLDAAETAQSTLERTLSSLDPQNASGEMHKLNQVATTARWPVSANTFRILDLANYYAELTESAFDFTAQPLYALHAAEAQPSEELINATLQNVGRSHVTLFDDGAIAFTAPLAHIDLMSLADSYALDLCILELRRGDVQNVLVRFGQSIRCIGKPGKNLNWEETLYHPIDAKEPIGQVDLSNRFALVSRSLSDGIVLDPRTGKEVDQTISVSVLGPTATEAHALAEALMVEGLQEAPNLLAKFPGYEALIIPQTQTFEIWMTTRFESRFTTNPQYKSAVHILPPSQP